jgi:phage baseplate assembly protein W
MSFDLSIEKGDIKISPRGSIETVSGNSKLKQDIVKILLTDLGDNKFHPKYGSHVGALQIGHYADDKLMSLDIESSAKNALRNLMGLQRAQSRRQALTPGEVIVDVLSVIVKRDEVDPRLYNIFVSVLTQELTEVSSLVSVRII